jgi:hypothetical protein
LRRNSHEANQKNNFFQNTLFFFKKQLNQLRDLKDHLLNQKEFE